MIDGKDGGHIWADRYDRDLTDIAHAIVDQLKIKLLPEERKAIDTVPTENIEAYTYYLKGRRFLRMWTKAYLLLARRMFSKAVELDPFYARAYAGIADCDSLLVGWHGADVRPEDILAASAKALALDGDLPEAHASRGVALYLSGQHEEARVELDRAIALDPTLYEAHFFYGGIFSLQGNFEKAAPCFERATEIQPDDYRSPLVLYTLYRSLGRHEDAERIARVGLARAERALKLHPEDSSPAGLGAAVLAALGERNRAMQWAAQALSIDPEDHSTHYNAACVYSLLGESDKAIDLLEKLLPKSGSTRKQWFTQDPDFAPIRSHPRYGKLMELIGNLVSSG